MIERPCGKRPCQRWTDTMKKDLTKINANFNICIVTNRGVQRIIVEVAKDFNGAFLLAKKKENYIITKYLNFKFYKYF